MVLSKEEILAGIAERKALTIDVDVPEWGGVVRIRLLSVAELKTVGFFGGLDRYDLPVRLLTAALAGEDGQPLFSKSDFKALAQADFGTTIRVFEAAAVFNSLDERTTAEAAADFDEAQDEDDSTS